MQHKNIHLTRRTVPHAKLLVVAESVGSLGTAKNMKKREATQKQLLGQAKGRDEETCCVQDVLKRQVTADGKWKWSDCIQGELKG